MLDEVQTLKLFPAETWTYIRPLGRGGQSETALYRHSSTGVQAAIKRLHARHVADLKQLELFFREGAVLRTLTHPGIPRVLDVFVVRDGDGPAELYIAQTFFEGRNLLEFLAGSARPSHIELKSWLADLLDIATYLHTRLPPVFHRDIKPSNIIIKPDGRATLIDFGAVATGWARTDASTVVGTPGYTAPEQFSGVVGARTDLYSLGAVAWEIATGRTPTVDQDTGRLLVPDGLDHCLARFIRTTTSTIPSERPISAEEALAILTEEPPEPAPVRQRSQRSRKSSVKRRRRPANSIDALFEEAESVDPDTNSADDDEGPGEEEAIVYVEPEVVRPAPEPLPFEIPALPPVPRPVDGDFRELFIEMAQSEKPPNPWTFWSLVSLGLLALGLVSAARHRGFLPEGLLPVFIATAVLTTGTAMARSLSNTARRISDPSSTVAGRLFVYGTMATATVINCSIEGAKGPNAAKVAFVFATPDEPRFHASAMVPSGFVPHCQAGSTIGVVYNPNLPSENRILPWY